MPPADVSSTQQEQNQQTPSETVRSTVSLLIAIHLLCLLIILVAAQSPRGSADSNSLLQRLGRTLGVYGQNFHFETHARLHLTHGTYDDVDHRIEYLAVGAKPTPDAEWLLLSAGIKGTDRYQRFQRLADLLAYSVDREDDDTAAIIAASVGKHLHSQLGIKTSHLRVRKHILQSRTDLAETNEARRNPNDLSYFRETYRAQILDLGKGDFRVQKIEERGQVAPATRGATP